MISNQFEVEPETAPMDYNSQQNVQAQVGVKTEIPESEHKPFPDYNQSISVIKMEYDIGETKEHIHFDCQLTDNNITPPNSLCLKDETKLENKTQIFYDAAEDEECEWEYAADNSLHSMMLQNKEEQTESEVGKCETLENKNFHDDSIKHNKFDDKTEFDNSRRRKGKKTASSYRAYKCSMCSKRFSKMRYLQKHQACHSEIDAYSCSICGEHFKCLNAMERHNMFSHSSCSSKGAYQCGSCPKSFNRMEGLKEHLRIHTGEKPFKCSICGETFTWNQQYQKHKRTHTGEKAYKCITCGESFDGPFDLKRHLVGHTGEEPFRCTECGKSFLWMYKLKQHMLTHTGEKPHKCIHCGKTYRLSHHIQRHLKSHEQGRVRKTSSRKKSLKKE